RPDHSHRRPRERPHHALDGPLPRGRADPGVGPAGAAGGAGRADHLRGHGRDRRRVLRCGAPAGGGDVVPRGDLVVSAELVRRARGFSRIVVATAVDPPASPCGACRQLLAEFGLDLQVIAVGPKTERRWVLRDLLPDAFAKATLTK